MFTASFWYVIPMDELTKIQKTKSFKDFCERSFHLLIARNPVAATHLGLTDYNHLWPDISKEGVLQDIKILKALHFKLKEFSTTELDSQEEKEDYELLDWYLDIALFELEEMRFWIANPRITQLIVSGLYELLLKTQQDEEGLASVISRLKGISHLVEDIKTRVTEPVQLWVDGELKACETLPTFLESIIQHFVSITDESKEVLSKATKLGLEAINQYQEWLQSLKGAPSLPCNRELYEKLINKRRLGMDASEIEELGKQYRKEIEKILEDLVTKLPGDSISEVRENIRKKHPVSFEDALEHYRHLAKKAKAFLIENDILSIPPNEAHEVVYTPPPVRHLLSVAAAYTPGKFDDPQMGRYWLSPSDDKRMLEEHNYASMGFLMVHESYPGHNFHFMCANTHPSYVRTEILSYPSPNLGFMYPSQGAEIIEGWALYTEEMMLGKGFEYDPTNPEELENLEIRYMLMNAVRWRATRIVIDVQLHTGQISYEEAVKYLQKATGFSETTSRAGVLMFSQSPGYFLSYLLGKHLLVNLKEKLGIPDKEFHDKIVYSGFVPFWFLRDYIFS